VENIPSIARKAEFCPEPPAIGELAESLLLQSHSAVGLVDRAEAAGAVYQAAAVSRIRSELEF
jgi:hypothetical protein